MKLEKYLSLSEKNLFVELHKAGSQEMIGQYDLDKVPKKYLNCEIEYLSPPSTMFNRPFIKMTLKGV